MPRFLGLWGVNLGRGVWCSTKETFFGLSSRSVPVPSKIVHHAPFPYMEFVALALIEWRKGGNSFESFPRSQVRDDFVKTHGPLPVAHLCQACM